MIIAGYPANTSAGYTYVVYGGSTRKSGAAWSATQTLATGGGNLIDGTDGFRLDGVTANDYSGFALATTDLNGDGKDDAIVGAYGANSGAGYVYMVSGSRSTVWSSSTLLNALP